jgi:hypothetical protein
MTGTQLNFSALGGIGPKTFKIESGLGELGLNGQFVAGSSEERVLVSVVDSRGNRAEITIDVYAPLSVAAASGVQFVRTSQTVPFVPQTVQFNKVGGFGSVEYAIEPAGSGSINANGLYTAPTAAPLPIQVNLNL